MGIDSRKPGSTYRWKPWNTGCVVGRSSHCWTSEERSMNNYMDKREQARKNKKQERTESSGQSPKLRPLWFLSMVVKLYS